MKKKFILVLNSSFCAAIPTNTATSNTDPEIMPTRNEKHDRMPDRRRKGCAPSHLVEALGSRASLGW
eukprot:CAMPEP_0118957752 /NCGR_PEP_ID=MMETSP1169-20130426/62264_1 /TAXON_ID=36882 /ORGANISM="Pyramimonas obovata, Strain CCMP722" /LENGTH=66 /DNA_ID=CAMNT_0006905851 /DNA_START=2432 /DNA_END=2629 /DNA_ORIENTATION=-